MFSRVFSRQFHATPTPTSQINRAIKQTRSMKLKQKQNQPMHFSFSCFSFSRLIHSQSHSHSQSNSVRPFRILGLQQIAIGGESKSALSSLWVDLFGLTKISEFRSESENVNEDILKLGSGPAAVEIDLMEPIDRLKSPKVHIPPLNHIGLWVDDLKSAVEFLKSSGVRFTPGGIRKGAAGFDVIFIHPKGSEKEPKSGEGVLIELVQAPEEIIRALTK